MQIDLYIFKFSHCTNKKTSKYNLNMRFVWYSLKLFPSYSGVSSGGLHILLLDLRVKAGVVCWLGGFVTSIAMVIVIIVLAMASMGIMPLQLKKEEVVSYSLMFFCLP